MSEPRRFEHFLAIDWSGAAGPRQAGIALAIAHSAGGPPVLVDPGSGWSRSDVLAILRDELPPDTLVGLDLGIGLPFHDCEAFFPEWNHSPPDAESLWALVDLLSGDDDNLSANRFVGHPQIARYFRHLPEGEGTHFRCDGASHGRGRFRMTERVQAAMGCKPYSNFNLVGAAQVGKSSLTGMRVLNRLRGHVPVWPVDPLPETGSVIVEIYTTIAAMEAGRTAASSKIRSWEELDHALHTLGSPKIGLTGPMSDHASDALLTAAWLRQVAEDPARWHPPAMTPEIARTEGWTFGAL